MEKNKDKDRGILSNAQQNSCISDKMPLFLDLYIELLELPRKGQFIRAVSQMRERWGTD